MAKLPFNTLSAQKNMRFMLNHRVLLLPQIFMNDDSN